MGVRTGHPQGPELKRMDQSAPYMCMCTNMIHIISGCVLTYLFFRKKRRCEGNIEISNQAGSKSIQPITRLQDYWIDMIETLIILT